MQPYIFPPIGKIIKRPLIGSGTISRRIKLKLNKKRLTLKNNALKRKTFTSATNQKRIAKPIFFQNAFIKIIFEYWNRQGFPFVSHKLIENQTSISAINKINNALKYTSKNEIIEAIDNCYFLFSASWFKYKQYYFKNKLTLPQFFSYDTKRYKIIASSIPDYPKSWFKECLQGEEYIQKTYSKLNKDKFPYITKELIKTWEQSSNQDCSSPVIKNILIASSIKLNNFCANNNYNWNVICDVIDKMLNKWKSINIKHVNYLVGDRFWEQTIPQELIRYGIADKKQDFKF